MWKKHSSFLLSSLLDLTLLVHLKKEIEKAEVVPSGPSLGHSLTGLDSALRLGWYLQIPSSALDGKL